jgi:hypothetical protein
MDVLKFLTSEPRMALGLAVQVILLGIILTYIWKFRRTSRLFETFQQQWAAAESSHKTLLSEAHERVSNLAIQPQDTMAFHPRRPALNSETRNHVVSMSRNGVSAEEIARTCSLPESAVNVVLGLARLQESRNA